MKLSVYKAASLAVVAAILVFALCGGRLNDRTERGRQVVATKGSNALELQVINVNPVIARQFHLKEIAGVLLNEDPQGTTKRIVPLKRGDVLLEYNRVIIQSADHLAHLMAQSHPGETITFRIVRSGREFTLSTRIPESVDVNLLQGARWDILVVLGILAAVFTALFMDWIHRTVCVVLGAAVMVIAGTWLGFYDQTRAFDSIRVSPILIFVGMSVFSVLLEQIHFLDYSAKKMILRLKGNVLNVVFVLCGLTFVFSLFINNLSTILVIIPITLYITRGLNINPVPVVTAEIIASNLGGASTIIGDFPNMLIASSTGLLFQDFLIFMTPICFLLLLSLLWYIEHFDCVPRRERRSTAWQNRFLDEMKEEVAGLEAAMDWPAVRRVLGILGVVILAFLFLPRFRIATATIALAGGFSLLAVENKRAKDVLKRISLSDVLFFLALFILVGGAVHSGLLKYLSNGIHTLSMGSGMLYCILLMWSASIVTAFLNAGPSTVFLIPVAMNAPLAGASDALVWWALSLGVLAGSSATLTGATAGIVTQTLLEDNRRPEGDGRNDDRLTFKNYSRTGVPVAFMFLCLSSIYIVILCAWMGVR